MAKLTFKQWEEQLSKPIGPVPGPAEYLRMKHGIVLAEQMLLDAYQEYLHDDESGAL